MVVGKVLAVCHDTAEGAFKNKPLGFFGDKNKQEQTLFKDLRR